MDNSPIVFLCGPPGAGKSTLGAQACSELGLRFLDFSDPESPPTNLDDERKALEAVIAHRTTDVIALSWTLQQSDEVLKLVQRSGEILLLWTHPEDMQARSGQSEPLFTPTGAPETRGGFGEDGTDCPEYRRLRRAADERALLVGMESEKAVEEVKEWIDITIQEFCGSVGVIEGIYRWVVDWQVDLGADKKAAHMLLDTMALYIHHLRSGGASEEEIAEVYDDLQAAGTLVFEYDAPKGDKAEKVLSNFRYPPWEYEFRYKFTDSERALKRYRRNLQGFTRFLREAGLIGKEE